MRPRRLAMMLCLAASSLSWAAYGELQEIRVGGKLEIYGATYTDFFAPAEGMSRYRNFSMRGRAIGPNGTVTSILADRKHGGGTSFLEQRTRLHVQAGFSDGVSAFAEIDSIDTWGDDFRSLNYLNGVDTRADTSEDAEIFQSYIEAASLWGTPLTVKVGRQELEFGSGWLVGADPGPDPFTGLSFDAIRVTYSGDTFAADVWWGKVAESMGDFGHGDVDFYGIYLACQAVEDMTFDLYWMYLRDDQAINLGLSPLSMGLGRVFGLSDFDSTNLHTAGARWAGKRGPWDWETEAAYQWGEADALGALFRTYPGLFGDDQARWANWAAHAEAGHTFETAWAPRVFAGGAYYGGEDRRAVSFLQWINPFDTHPASVSFNRLFSTWREDDVLDGCAGLANFWKAYAGVTVAPVEKLEVETQVRYLAVLEPFRYPMPFFFPWQTHRGAQELGWQTSLYVTYQYSADVSVDWGYTHFFTGDAIRDGSFIDGNGLQFIGGYGDDDIDYVFGAVTVAF